MRSFPTTVAAFLLVLHALSGCGGGSGGVVGTRPDVDPAPPSMGLPAVAVYSPWPNRTIRLLDPDGRDGHRITDLASDGASGYDVEYTSGGERKRVHLTADRGGYGRDDGELSVYLDFVGDEPSEYRHRFVHEDFEHLRVGSFLIDDSGNLTDGYLVHGSESGSLLSGSAAYTGKLVGELRHLPPTLVRPFVDEIDADVTLNVDFGEGSVEGLVDRLLVARRHRHDSVLRAYEYAPDARFVILPGAVSGSDFSAEIMGYGTLLDGFAGSVRGAFFGPGATELGGVLGASRGEHDVFVAYIVGEDRNTRRISAEELSRLLSGNRSVLEGSWTRLAHSYPRFDIVPHGPGSDGDDSPDVTGVTLSNSATHGVDTRFDGETLRVTVRQSRGGIVTFDSSRDDYFGSLDDQLILFNESESASSAALLAVDWTDPGGSDYLARGSWIHLSDRDATTGQFTAAEVGSFVNGSGLSPWTPPAMRGFARYVGEARGIYSIQYGTGHEDVPSGSDESGRFDGKAEFTVSFRPGGRPLLSGCLVCEGESVVNGLFTDGRTGATGVVIARPAHFQVSDTIRTLDDGSGRFSAQDSVAAKGLVPTVSPFMRGSVGGRFSETGDEPDRPPGAPSGFVAGTIGAAETFSEGTRASLAGSFEVFGPWAEEGVQVHFRRDGVRGGMSYGLASRDGEAQPWALGPEPSTGLFDNRDIWGEVAPGTVRTLTWSGRMAGLTPTGEAVNGAVELKISAGSPYLPTLKFDQLTSSSGAWGDGSLEYKIFTIHDNSFEGRKDRDAPTEIRGEFFGSSHEAMGGYVERSDLTAVFGGAR